MSTPAQRDANASNARFSTGPKTPQGKAISARNSIQHGLFASPENLTPADSARVKELILELSADFESHAAAHINIIRDFAIAAWRTELFHRMERYFYESAIAKERAQTESAMLMSEYGDGILLGRAIQRDAKGPKVLPKLMRYEGQILKKFHYARKAYYYALERISNQADFGSLELLM